MRMQDEHVARLRVILSKGCGIFRCARADPGTSPEDFVLDDGPALALPDAEAM